MLFKSDFFVRFQAHFFHRSNWWRLTLLCWLAIQWKFNAGLELFAAPADAMPAYVLIVSYFAISPALFFSLAGVEPHSTARHWSYLVRATWPIYVLDHLVNLITLVALYALMGAPWGWGLFLPITHFFYITFYAARAYLRRIGYQDEFNRK
jgi:hypothetical protein